MAQNVEVGLTSRAEKKKTLRQRNEWRQTKILHFKPFGQDF